MDTIIVFSFVICIAVFFNVICWFEEKRQQSH